MVAIQKFIHGVWQQLVALWPVVGPALGVAAGVVGKGLFDMLMKSVTDTRDYRHQMVVLMIPKLHEYAEKYYMRAGGDASRAARYMDENVLRDPRNLTDRQVGTAMFYVGKWLDTLNVQAQAIRGVFLQDLTGEVVVAYLQRSLLDTWNSGPLTERERVTIRETAGKATSLAEFLDRVDGDLAPLRTTFRKWLLNAPVEIRSLKEKLDMWARVFIFEVNFPYRVWYRQAPRLVLSPPEEEMMKATLSRLRQQGMITSKDRKNYLRKLGVPTRDRFAQSEGPQSGPSIGHPIV